MTNQQFEKDPKMDDSHPAPSDFEALLETFYRGFLRSGNVCIDIGAHEGRHMNPMLECIGSSGRMLAFEPIPALASKLAATIVERGLEASVTIHQVALADASGTSTFVIATDAPAYSGLLERVYDVPTGTQKIEVTLAKLDEVFSGEDRLDYIKIDAEGAEWSILKGARKVLDRYRPVVSFEFGEASYRNYGVVPEEVHDYFSSLGYQVFDIKGRELDREAFSTSSVRQEVWDYIALGRERSSAELLAPLRR
jgi:FkbM family methyltransferase